MAKRKKLCALFVLLVPTALATVSCGANSGPNRYLKSMVINPAVADAQNFPGGQVQFAATGTFSSAPSPDVVSFVPGVQGWSVSDTAIATIGQSTGMAQCIPGAAGTVTVGATTPNGFVGHGVTAALVVAAPATLTCP